jgi:hypothetical protein
MLYFQITFNFILSQSNFIGLFQTYRLSRLVFASEERKRPLRRDDIYIIISVYVLLSLTCSNLIEMFKLQITKYKTNLYNAKQ